MSPVPDEQVNTEVQITTISSSVHNNGPDISSLLEKGPSTDDFSDKNSFASEQMKDATLQPLLEYLLKGKLPVDPISAAKILPQAVIKIV